MSDASDIIMNAAASDTKELLCMKGYCVSDEWEIYNLKSGVVIGSLVTNARVMQARCFTHGKGCSCTIPYDGSAENAVGMHMGNEAVLVQWLKYGLGSRTVTSEEYDRFMFSQLKEESELMAKVDE